MATLVACDEHPAYRPGCVECGRRARRYQNLRSLGRIAPLTPAVGVARRLQALAALGWSAAAIGARLGTSDVYVRQLRQHPGRATGATRSAVAAVYADLSMRLPEPSSGATRTRIHAAAQGWPPPLAYDDETIDQPDATPAEGWQRTPASSLAAKRTERAEAIRALSAAGLTATEVGVRLGITREAVAQSLSRHKALCGDLSA